MLKNWKYLKWVIEGFDSGLDADLVMSLAAEKYGNRVRTNNSTIVCGIMDMIKSFQTKLYW